MFYVEDFDAWPKKMITLCARGISDPQPNDDWSVTGFIHNVPVLKIT